MTLNYQKGSKLDTIDNRSDACVVMSTFYRQLKTYELVEEIKQILFLSTCYAVGNLFTSVGHPRFNYRGADCPANSELPGSSKASKRGKFV